MRILHQCAYPGCHRLCEGKYCEIHRKESAPNRETTSKWAYMYHRTSPDGRSWRAERKNFLMEHPWCAVCGKPATEIHHEPPHNGSYRLFWDKSTWVPICHSCHSKITAKESGFSKKGGK